MEKWSSCPLFHFPHQKDHTSSWAPLYSSGVSLYLLWVLQKTLWFHTGQLNVDSLSELGSNVIDDLGATKQISRNTELPDKMCPWVQQWHECSEGDCLLSDWIGGRPTRQYMYGTVELTGQKPLARKLQLLWGSAYRCFAEWAYSSTVFWIFMLMPIDLVHHSPLARDTSFGSGWLSKQGLIMRLKCWD